MGCSASTSSFSGDGSKFPLHGLSQAYLCELVRTHGAQDWTVSEFCDKVVKPVTLAKACSLTALLLSSPDTSSLAREKADVFISYAWKYSMGNLIDCLELGPADRYLWIDVAVVNQHTSTSVGQEEWLQTFSSALKAIGKAELILMPWYKPIPVERCWCVFEQYVITSSKIPFKATMLPKDELEVRVALRDNKFMFKTFLQTFASIDCEKSTAFKDADRIEILGLLRRTNAITATNNATMESVKRFLVDVALDEAERQKTLSQSPNEKANVFYGLAMLLDSLGDFKTAIEWYARVVPIRRALLISASLGDKKGLKPAQEDLGSALNGYGAALMKLDRLEESTKVFEESYELKKISVGEDDADTIKAREWLASILHRQKKFSEALPIYEEIVAQSTRVLGPDHENTGNSLNNLASCLNALDRPSEALEKYKVSLAIKKKRLGDSHPEVATVLNNIAVCYDNLNQPDSAIDCYREAIAIQKKAMGENHISVATAMHNLAMTLDEKGDKEEARQLGQQAADIFERALGKDHMNSRTTREMWGGGSS